MKRWPLLLLPLLLMGCKDDVRRQLAACNMGADKVYPGLPDDSVKRNDYIYDCMIAAGYEMDFKNETCPKRLLTIIDSDCFYKTSWLRGYSN